MADKGYGEFRLAKDAIDAIHEACEDYIVGINQEAKLAADHDHRVTVMPKGKLNFFFFLD